MLAESDHIVNDHQTFTKVYYEDPGTVHDVLGLARSLYDLKEYRKCAHLLEPITNEVLSTMTGTDASETGRRLSPLRQNCMYLKNHALFLVSE